MRARPGTPRDPKSHLFVTKWVAVAPFGTWRPGSYAEFRRGSRQGGPTPSISTFFLTILEPKNAQMSIFVNFSKFRPPPPSGFGVPWGPWGPYGAHGAHGGRMGPIMAPMMPIWAPGAQLPSPPPPLSQRLNYPPQQGDSNFGCGCGWGGEHQWGQSWRDRPPAARPQASPCCLCLNTETQCS